MCCSFHYERVKEEEGGSICYWLLRVCIDVLWKGEGSGVGNRTYVRTVLDVSRTILLTVVALIMGKNGEKMDFGYGKTFLEKVSWGGPETPFCGISGPIPACGGVYTEKWTKF